MARFHKNPHIWAQNTAGYLAAVEIDRPLGGQRHSLSIDFHKVVLLLKKKTEGDSMDVGELRALRQRLGVTQALLARAVGVDRIKLSLWENGVADMKPEEIRNIGTYLQRELEIRLRELGEMRQAVSA
jgi:DNA-binding XRE family transcriptional regulator